MAATTEKKRRRVGAPPRRSSPVAYLLLILPSLVSASTPSSLASGLLTRARRSLDVSSLFGSPTTAPSYERIASQPVFAVTTPWGSPYLIFERAEDDDVGDGSSTSGGGGGGGGGANFGEVMGPEQPTRQVVLYFLDPHDAAAHRDEMLQLEQMKGADMRIMATSLGRAVRQASNLGAGLPTGQPIDDLTGKMKSPDEGGTLRYKIVPPKRELFYAARCRGRERVGLFGRTPGADAAVMSNSRRTVGEYVGGLKAEREDRLKTRRGREEAAADPARARYGHMEGALGVPVFHCPGLRRRHSALKRAVNPAARRSETPLFFSYEDLVDAWVAMRDGTKDKARLPRAPPAVEVFNLMDVVTSIDRDQWTARRRAQQRRERTLEPLTKALASVPVVKRLVPGAGGGGAKVAERAGKKTSGLEQVTFVPSSRNVAYKDRITETGNVKARLPRMRAWGREMM